MHLLDDYPADSDIDLVSNTYLLNGVKYFIGISGHSGGYVSLDNIEESIIVKDEYDD